MNGVTPITFCLFLALSGQASAICFEEASRQYGVPEALLRATAKVESGNNPAAIGKSRGGTSDLGLMQINETWLPKLSRWGITREVLLKDSCMNLKVGAWIMAENFRRYGYTWDGVGAYNVGCAKLQPHECEKRRNRYSAKIYKALVRKERAGAGVLARNRSPAVLAHNQVPVTLHGIATVQFENEDLAAEKGDS